MRPRIRGVHFTHQPQGNTLRSASCSGDISSLLPCAATIALPPSMCDPSETLLAGSSMPRPSRRVSGCGRHPVGSVRHGEVDRSLSNFPRRHKEQQNSPESRELRPWRPAVVRVQFPFAPGDLLRWEPGASTADAASNALRPSPWPGVEGRNREQPPRVPAPQASEWES